MKIYDNLQRLTKQQIERRLLALDANALANPYSVEREDKSTHHYVGVDSSLTDAQIEACLGPISQSDTQAETAERERQEFLSLIVSKWQNEFIPLRNWARTKGYPG